MLDAAFPGEVLGNDLRRWGEFNMQNRQLVGGFAWKGAHGSSRRGSPSRVGRLLPFFRNSENNGVTEVLE